MSKKVCVIGEGNWGTAISTLLASNGYRVNLWCHDISVANSINLQNVNLKYFPNLKLDSKIKAVTNFQEAFSDVKFIFEAIPVKFLRDVFQKAKEYCSKDHAWVLLSKGIENETTFLPSQILDDVFKCSVDKVIISGPSFANDLIQNKFTGVDIAASNAKILEQVTKILSSDYFVASVCDDIIGMQVAGALKNVITLLVGIAKGQNYSDNTIAYIFTKGLEQISKLTTQYGGLEKTIYRLCGVGDLTLSAFGKYSKNLHLGVELAKGKRLTEITDTKNIFPESINTIKSLKMLTESKKIESKFFDELYKVVFENKDLSDLLKVI